MNKVVIYFYLALAAGLGIVTLILWQSQIYDYPRLLFLDVGQGDATLITTPAGNHILIDGGRDNAVIQKLGRYLPFYRRQIDLLILTHPDGDHFTGLVEVVKRYEIKNALVSGATDASPAFEELIKALQLENSQIFYTGEVFHFAIDDFLSLMILYPAENYDAKKVSDKNDTSVVTLALIGEVSALVMGDASTAVENQLVLKFNTLLNVDILRTGHHGSRTSSGENFLLTATPEISIISVGQNRYGHPDDGVVDRLKRHSKVMLTTQETGDIIIASDGKRFWLEKKR